MTCPACGKSQDGVKYLCADCWWILPAKERTALHAMDRRGEDVTSKLAKAVRIVCSKLGVEVPETQEEKKQSLAFDFDQAQRCP